MTERCLVIYPYGVYATRDARAPEALLEESIGLAMAIGIDVVASKIFAIRELQSATLFGRGHVEQIERLVSDNGVDVAIIGTQLSPIQQRNLEKSWNCKVIDRTALILEIFADRAQTKEGKLQVELAQLTYQKSRLVRSWTHLERQRGGHGFMGGPGERQIESDRRQINEKITKIKKQLKGVTRTRELHRKVRKDTPFPVVALVGYTNAGKSTLFNRLTGAKVMAEDALFATLDPTHRSTTLPSGQKIVLSDTVGFISDLPHDLVAAFRATLEEVVEADIILHVRDISHPDSTEQKKDVIEVLKSLLDEERVSQDVIEVHNKIDLLEGRHEENFMEGSVRISAVTGEGLEHLLNLLAKEIETRFYEQASLEISAGDGKSLAWLHAHGHVTREEVVDDIISLDVSLSKKNIERFRDMQKRSD